MRIASHPKHPNRPGGVPAVLAFLRQFCAAEGHQFWIEDISIRDLLGAGVLIPHNQITDAYLLGLAVHKGGELASLDQHVQVEAVPKGRSALESIPS